LFCGRSKTKGEVRLDDNETGISDARRSDATGVGAWVPSCRRFGIAKILKKRQLHPRQGDIVSPIDGTVVSRNVEMGQTVAAVSRRWRLHVKPRGSVNLAGYGRVSRQIWPALLEFFKEVSGVLGFKRVR
jgi:hypothetical protein